MCVIFFCFSFIHGCPDSAWNRLYVTVGKVLLQKWEICADPSSSFWTRQCFPPHTARNTVRSCWRGNSRPLPHLASFTSWKAFILSSVYIQPLWIACSSISFAGKIDLFLSLFRSKWIIWWVLNKGPVDRSRKWIQGTQPTLLLTRQHWEPWPAMP